MRSLGVSPADTGLAAADTAQIVALVRVAAIVVAAG